MNDRSLDCTGVGLPFGVLRGRRIAHSFANGMAGSKGGDAANFSQGRPKSAPLRSGPDLPCEPGQGAAGIRFPLRLASKIVYPMPFLSVVK